jgi:hypothetical protein
MATLKIQITKTVRLDLPRQRFLITEVSIKKNTLTKSQRGHRKVTSLHLRLVKVTAEDN